MSKQLPRFTLRPDEQNSSTHRRDEVMRTPPAFDTGTVYLQYGLADGQRAVVPDQQKEEGKFKSSK